MKHSLGFFIDKRIIDDHLTGGTWDVIRRSIMSPSVRKRSKSLIDINPVLYRNIKMFLVAIGNTMQQSVSSDLVKFKKFDPVPRPDDPIMTTMLVDFAIDPEREELARFLKQVELLSFFSPSSK